MREQALAIIVQEMPAGHRDDRRMRQVDVGTGAVLLVAAVDAGHRQPVQPVERRRADMVGHAAIAEARGVGAEEHALARHHQHRARDAAAQRRRQCRQPGFQDVRAIGLPDHHDPRRPAARERGPYRIGHDPVHLAARAVKAEQCRRFQRDDGHAVRRQRAGRGGIGAEAQPHIARQIQRSDGPRRAFRGQQHDRIAIEEPRQRRHARHHRHHAERDPAHPGKMMPYRSRRKPTHPIDMPAPACPPHGNQMKFSSFWRARAGGPMRGFRR
ncbi:hypothetical protein WR25_03996 [Diploscapter pachys]|uniref:Uncharacterized protein n=1 Tax=Diploscapter pachys TaxID=2018661 RepID=A0A2A2K5F4_9BILA|nr:hypothetical protein WR25_03996 [Diploscapter pachys]